MTTATQFETMDDVRAANKARGHHFFEPGTLRFFRSRIGSELHGGRYFITSEQFVGSSGRGARLFTVREVKPDGSCATVGEFQAYATRSQALGAIKRLLLA